MTYITNKDYFYEVSLGRVAGVQARVLPGSDNSVVAATPIDLGNQTFPDVAEKYSIVSDSTSDNSSGNGARVVQIRGLDANLDEQIEIVILNGTTPVETVNTYLRYFGTTVVNSGPTQFNEGNITTSGVTSFDTISVIAVGEALATPATYTVPNGKQARIIRFAFNTVSVATGPKAFVSMRAVLMFPLTSTWILALQSNLDSEVTTETASDNPVGAVLTAGTDLKFQYTASAIDLVLRTRLYIVEEDVL